MLLYGMFISPLYLMIVGPAMLLALLAQVWVKSAYAKYMRMQNTRGMTGAEAAYAILQAEGVADVRIEQYSGFMSDHYDPRKKVLRLSPQVYQNRSVAAVGIAAHEAGHALQHAQGYAFLSLRSMMVPVASFGSYLAFPLIIIGFLLQFAGLIQVGIIFFGLVVLFQFVTLPVEFNASSRAKEALSRNMILTTGPEMNGVSSVLTAAAMTYVAATLVAVAQLLYHVMLFSGNSRD